MSLVELQQAAIKRRLEIEAELGFDVFEEEQTAEALAKAEVKAALKRGYSREQKRKAESELPRRQSARVKGISPDGLVEGPESVSSKYSHSFSSSSSSYADARILPPEGDANALDHIPRNGGSVEQAKAVLAEVLSGVNGIRRLNGCPELVLNSKATEEVVLAPSSTKYFYQRKDAPSRDVQFQRMCKLEIKSDKYVVKAMPENSNRIYSIGFHPCNDRIIAIAGGRNGHVTLWAPDINNDKLPAASKRIKSDTTQTKYTQGGEDGDGEGENEGDDDSVDDSMNSLATFVLHGTSPVNSFLVASQRPHLLLSASYAGTIRSLDLTSGQTELIHTDDDAPSCLAMDEQSSSGLTFFVSNRNGQVYHIDTRLRSQVTRTFTAHPSKITSLSMRPGTSSFLTACGGGDRKTVPCVKIWDSRKFSKHGDSHSSSKIAINALATIDHRNSISSASFSPNGEWIASVSSDDLVRFFDVSGGYNSSDQPTHRSKHDNMTGRWLTTFKCAWDEKAESTLLLGNMKRAVDLYQVSKRELKEKQLPFSPLLSAVPTQIAAHPSLDVIAGGTASGRCYLFQ